MIIIKPWANRFIPEPFAGYTRGPIGIVHTDHEDDEALIAHEKEHVRWFWRHPIKTMMVPFSDKHKLAYEVAGFKREIALNVDPNVCAVRLSTHYGLDLTTEEALAELTKP